LYEIAAGEGSLEEKRRAILNIGAEYLGVRLGFVSAIDRDEDRFEVLVSTDDSLLAEDAVYDLSMSYCRRCVESGSSLAVADVPGTDLHGGGAYEEHRLDAYIGTPVRVDGEIVGTVCFADAHRREQEFTELERTFVELAARLLGREREMREYERELEERERRLEGRARELDRSERKYEALLQTAPDAIFVAERETGQVLEANEAAAELTGVPSDSLVGRDIHSFHGSGGEGRHWAEFERFFTGGSGTMSRYDDGTQVRLRRADGGLVPVEIAANTVQIDGRECVQGIVRDISDRRERERELRVRNRAIEEAPVGITIADADGETPQRNGLVYANRRFQEMTGYDWPDVAGQNCRFLQGPETDDETVDRLRDHIDSETAARAEIQNYRKEGTPFWNELSIAPVEDGTGSVTHYVGFQRDITERKRQEQLVSVLNRVLRHNLRNGLNVVLARTAQLREHVDGEPEELIDAVERRADELVAIGEQAGAIDRAVTTRTTADTRDIVPIVEDVAGELREIDPAATVTVDVPETQPVYATETVRAAIRELGTNAIEHGGPEPRVSVSVAREEANGTVTVRVSDDGPGLPDQERTVLDRGYETPLEHGSGLGLWFVNWVVSGVGGDIETTVEDGTTVTVSLQDPTAENSDVSQHRPSMLGT
jgi:PAS domain S-box-containing protein